MNNKLNQVFLKGDQVRCRLCDKEGIPINDFGFMPIANGFYKSVDFDKYRFKLKTLFCESCKLFQLVEQPDRELMFNESYPFFTGQSNKMVLHFKKLVFDEILPRIKHKNNPLVVEIGSNDGTLLQEVKELGINHLGVDPSLSVITNAKSKGVNAVQDFFGTTSATQIRKDYGLADVIVAANVICHLPDLRDLMSGISELLTYDGVFIFEEPYLVDMIKKTSFDQIYDEHYYIFSILSIKSLCDLLGLKLFDAQHQSTHGGSMRYYVTRDLGTPVNKRVLDGLNLEFRLGLDKPTVYINFERSCQEKKNQLLDLISDLKSKNHSVAGYAATSKSTTVLNYCGLSNQELDYICDSTPEKIGCLTPGTNIPIVSIKEMHTRPPDFMVLFAWNHEFEILEKEKEFLLSKVKWIRFVPNVEIFDFG